jgi:hypothetical protein
MDQNVGRRVAALMGFEAATLVVGSLLHLSGSVQGRSEPFNPEHAGVAEAVIATVLVELSSETSGDALRQRGRTPAAYHHRNAHQRSSRMEGP